MADKTEEEIKAEAKAILQKAWAEKVAKYADPSTFFSRENKAGEIEFYIKVDEGFLGKAEILYSPQAYIEFRIRDEEKEIKGLVSNGASEATLGIFKIYSKRRLNHIASILIRNAQRDFEWIVAQQGAVALSTFYKASGAPVDKVRFQQVNNALEDFYKQRNEWLDFFYDEVREEYVAPQELFCLFYDDQKVFWTQVKKCYKENKKYPNPLNMVKAAFPDLPEDLLNRLEDSDPYASQPATLALLATTKITNAPRNISSIRALQLYLEESRRLAKTKTKVELKITLRNYKERLDELWAIRAEVSKLTDKEKERK